MSKSQAAFVSTALAIIYLIASVGVARADKFEDLENRIFSDVDAISVLHDLTYSSPNNTGEIYSTAATLQTTLQNSQRIYAARPTYSDAELEAQMSALVSDLGRYTSSLTLFVSSYYTSQNSLDVAIANMNRAWADFQRDAQLFGARKSQVGDDDLDTRAIAVFWIAASLTAILVGGYFWRRSLIGRFSRAVASHNEVIARWAISRVGQVDSVYNRSKLPAIVSWVGFAAVADGDAGWIAAVVLALFCLVALPLVKAILRFAGMSRVLLNPSRSPSRATITVHDPHDTTSFDDRR
ncbi:hypothetical protein BH09CHL1_BH09CHL1_05550 [soil metagenome]